MRAKTNHTPLDGGATGVNLPVAQAQSAYRAAFTNALPRATFISQLIAERHHLPPQRERRRTTMDVAVEAYADTEQNAIRRMPPGYRKTLLA